MNGVKVLTLIVLREITQEVDVNDTLHIRRKDVITDRVYRLDEEGVTVTIYKTIEGSSEESESFDLFFVMVEPCKFLLYSLGPKRISLKLTGYHLSRLLTLT